MYNFDGLRMHTISVLDYYNISILVLIKCHLLSKTFGKHSCQLNYKRTCGGFKSTIIFLIMAIVPRNFKKFVKFGGGGGLRPCNIIVGETA